MNSADHSFAFSMTRDRRSRPRCFDPFDAVAPATSLAPLRFRDALSLRFVAIEQAGFIFKILRWFSERRRA